MLTHINHLPVESATARKRLGEYAGWDRGAELTAATVDELRKLNFYFISANSDRTPPEPVFVPRPGTRVEPDSVPLSQLADILKE